VGFAHGLFFWKNKGRLKACVQVSDDLLYFRGHSPRYQLNTAEISFFSIVFPLMWRSKP